MPLHPLYQNQRSDSPLPIEIVCKGDPERGHRQCPAFSTKPGNEPAELMRWIETALDLDALKEQGATFAYPEALNSREWVSIKALAVARGREREKESRRREEDREKQTKLAELQAMRDRNG